VVVFSCLVLLWLLETVGSVCFLSLRYMCILVRSSALSSITLRWFSQQG
jgi:hypothetical protein